MGQLGLEPTLLGSVGSDFDDYRSWLDRHGVDTESVHISDMHQTARFVCTTDADGNQIATFYAGAMADARLIELGPVAERLGSIDLLLIRPTTLSQWPTTLTSAVSADPVRRRPLAAAVVDDGARDH